ncbi:MAG: ABC transporter substrate-binding protein, partial [Bacteroidota bacterium]
IGARDLMELQEDPKFNANYHSRYLANFGYTYLALNMRPQLTGRKPFFTDRRVRKAMALLAPVDDIIRVNYRNKVMRIAGPVSPMKYGCNRDLALITVDIPAAKALLDSAGWIDTDGDNVRDKLVDGERVPFVFELNYLNVSEGWRTIAEMMADGFYQAGVKAELKPVDPKLHWERATDHDFDMLLSAWAQGSSPDDHRQIWHTASWNGGSNYTGFGTPATDALIDSISATLDPARRASLNQRFQRIVYEEHPYIFICASSRKIVVHKRFRNANMYYEKPNLVLNNFLLAAPAAGQSQSSLAE